MEMVGKQMHAWCFHEDGQRHGEFQDVVVMVGKQMLAWYFHEDEQRYGECQDVVVMVDKQMLVCCDHTECHGGTCAGLAKAHGAKGSHNRPPAVQTLEAEEFEAEIA